MPCFEFIFVEKFLELVGIVHSALDFGSSFGSYREAIFVENGVEGLKGGAIAHKKA